LTKYAKEKAKVGKVENLYTEMAALCIAYLIAWERVNIWIEIIEI